LHYLNIQGDFVKDQKMNKNPRVDKFNIGIE